MIIKNRTTARNWLVYSSALTYTNYLSLDTTNAASSGANVWNTDPSDTVFYLSTFPENNSTSEEHVCYAFHSVEGFSKFGSYTGNGSADGAFVNLGFRPAYIMIKRTDAVGGWSINDAARDPTNLVTQYFDAQDPAAEYTAPFLDFTSNGFKMRHAAVQNVSGASYIFMAFAAQPFKYANAG
jgi:hypothetical protein